MGLLFFKSVFENEEFFLVPVIGGACHQEQGDQVEDH